MKSIKYMVMREDNLGTEDTPNIVRIYNDMVVKCSDSAFDSNYATAIAKSYNGEVTVEDIPDEPQEPTTEQRISDLEEQLAQSDETAIALYEAKEEQEVINAQQDEALMEIYEMIG